MLDIKNNLHKPIKECEPNAKNELTYLEWIIIGYANIGSLLSAEKMNYICNEASNEELNEILEELDYLSDK